MNLEQVKHKLSASYERINNMKVAINKVESCKSMLLLRRDEVLEDVKLMMNEMAQQLLNLQLCIEATVNSTVEERSKSLDAKKQDILNANSYLVEVCMEADRLLKGRNEDLLGRACQRIFTRFERAWRQLDLAGKIDARSMTSLVFKNNIRKFSRSTYIAKLQQLDQFQRVLDEQEFWVDEPSDSMLSDRPAAGVPLGQQSADAETSPERGTASKPKTSVVRRSPEHGQNSSSSSSRHTLETIHEMPENLFGSPIKGKEQVVVKKRPQRDEQPSLDHRQMWQQEVGQEKGKRAPDVRIREVDLHVDDGHNVLKEKQLTERLKVKMMSPPKLAALPADTWEEDFIQMDNMTMRSLVSLESSENSQPCGNMLPVPDVSRISGGSNVPMQSDLEFWKVDSCADVLDESVSTSNSESSFGKGASPGQAKVGLPKVSGTPAALAQHHLPPRSPEFSKEEEDFLWESDEEEKSNSNVDESSSQSALASPFEKKEDKGSVRAFGEVKQGQHEVRVGAVVPGPTGDSQKSFVKEPKPLAASGGVKLTSEVVSPKNIALATIQQHASDKDHTTASQGGGDGLAAPSSQAVAQKTLSMTAHDINITVGNPLSPASSSEQVNTIAEACKGDKSASKSPLTGSVQTTKMVQNDDEGAAQGWSSLTTWKRRGSTGAKQDKDVASNTSPTIGKSSTGTSDKQAMGVACNSLQSSSGAPQVQASGKSAQAKTLAETADSSRETASKSPEVQGSLKTICIQKLDIRRSLEHIGGGFFECPAKLVEKIYCDLSYPIGIATNSVGDVIVADTGHNLVKVIRNGIVINAFGERLARPSAVVVNEKDEILVKDDHCVWHFDPEGKLIKSFGRKYMSMPYGMGMMLDGTLVILDALRQRPKLLQFQQDGMMTAYPYQPLRDAPPNSKCRFLAVNGDEVLTSDLGCSCLYLTSVRGELHKTLASWGHGPGELNEPSGITVDSAGNWIVADSKNNRIQVFAPSGYYMCKLRLSEHIRRPSGIHLSRNGMLYIINYLDAQIKVYKIGVA